MSQSLFSGREALVEKLNDRECQYCDEGTLEKRTYKDNKAVVCTACETPALQLW